MTCACSGAPSVYSGAGTVSMIVFISARRSWASGMVPSSGRVNEANPALAQA